MNENVIESILNWFKLAKPEPTPRDASTQIGCHYEEVAEMLEATNTCADSMADYADLFKSVHGMDKLEDIDKLELLDALCDQIVTALGVGYMMGFDVVEALKEVNSSNWSKFENGKPIFDANGKIVKGVNYTKPSLKKHLKKPTLKNIRDTLVEVVTGLNAADDSMFEGYVNFKLHNQIADSLGALNDIMYYLNKLIEREKANDTD